MKLKYLGTAAAEGIPGLLCTCEKCVLARKRGGKDIRTRSQALVDDTLLIDLNADTMDHAIRFGLDLTRVRHCLITHVHEDHLYLEELALIRPGFTVVKEGFPPFTVYGSEETGERVRPICEMSAGRLEFVTVKPFEPFFIEGYRVTALPAAHGTREPLIYLIEKDGRALLYAHDTGKISEGAGEYLKKTKPRLSLVSLDCTEGMQDEILYDAHMCLGRDIRCREQLTEWGLCDQSTRFILNHFSHNGEHVLFDELAPMAEQCGFEVSWDGRELEW